MQDVSLYVLIISYLFRLYIGDHQGESPLQVMRMTLIQYVYCTLKMICKNRQLKFSE